MTELPQGPWQSIAIDFMGPLPSGDYVFEVTDYYSRYVEVSFSNSLIIHEDKTKEITTVKEVWICDPNYHKIRRSFALIFSKNYQCFEKLYQTLERVFHQISKHFEAG